VPDLPWNISLTLGALLVSALIAGTLAHRVHLPRVTAYLLVGVLLGPLAVLLLGEGRGFLPLEHLHDLEIVDRLAMALVLFTMGSHFTLERFRRLLPRMVRLSCGEMGFTFVLVCGGLLSLSVEWQLAVLLGVLAIATAPATTLLVLKETNSEGPVTEQATFLVAINNLACVVIFEVLFLFFTHEAATGVGFELARLAADLLGSVALGVFAGLLVSYACAMLSERGWLVLLVSVGLMVVGVCESLGMPYLLAFLAFGVTTANSSDRSREIVGQLDKITGLLCVVFFVLHGASFDLQTLGTPSESGPGLMTIAIGYIAFRSLGKCLGIAALGSPALDGPSVRRWLGPALLSQAGAALALSAMAAERHPELGIPLQLVVLGTVPLFELIGPILIRKCVLYAGEIPISQAIHHTSSTPLEELQVLWQRVLTAIGINPLKHRRTSDVTVSRAMRRDVKGIPAAARLNQVVDYIEHSHDSTYPVVDADNIVVGVIRYSDLRDVLFDIRMGSLVCASDLTVDEFDVVHPDDSIESAWRLMQKSHRDSVIVVSEDPAKVFVGVVRRRDLLQFFARGAVEAASHTEAADATNDA